MIKKICKGCGEVLQSEDKNKKAYIPFEKLLLGDNLICRQCFRLKNYGEVPKELSDKQEYVRIVKESIKKADYILAIFDATDIEASMQHEILDLLESKESIVVLNKIDLLEKYYSLVEISAWFRRKIIENNIFPQSFCFVSSKKNEGIKGILHKIKSLSSKKELKICVIGASNVGKSSVLNRLIGSDRLTTSKYSGTTKKNISTTIKYKDIKITFIDTPGIVPENRLTELVDPAKAVLLMPNKKLKETNLTINENQILFFDSLLYLKVKNKAKIRVLCSKNVQIHVSNEKKIKTLLEGDFFDFFTKEERKKYLEQEFVTESISLTKIDSLDIQGLGFLEADARLELDITYPQKLGICVRESMKFANKRQDDIL